MIEYNRPRTGGSLVNGEDELGHTGQPLMPVTFSMPPGVSVNISQVKLESKDATKKIGTAA